MMKRTSRNKPLSAAQSPSVTHRGPVSDVSTNGLLSTAQAQTFAARKRLLRQTSQALCRQRDRQTKEWKWLHSRKGLVVLYLHYQAQEINSHLRKVKRPPEKTEQLTVISFFSFSLPPFMSIISHLAWSSWWSLIAAMNAMNFMRFLYFLLQ